MADRAELAETDVTTLVAELEGYWRSLLSPEGPPLRSEVNPGCIDAVLPHAFVIERVARDVTRIRVAGQRLGDWIGMDPRGMPLSVFFHGASRGALAGHLRTLFDGPALVDLPLVSPRGLGRGRLAGRMLLLPLRDVGGSVSRALGAILVTGRDGTGARRFDLPEDGSERIEPQGTAAPRLSVIAGGARKGPGPSRRPALHLVVANG